MTCPAYALKRLRGRETDAPLLVECAVYRVPMVLEAAQRGGINLVVVMNM